MRSLFGLFSIGLIVGGMLACSTSPEGRSQMMLMPAAQMDSMGAKAFNDMKKQTPVSRDQRKIGYVKCITGLLTKQLEKVDEGTWEVQVFESDTVNAFALPGRKIGVYNGMFKVAQNGGQLAAVLGHEVGHVIANHGNERVSAALVTQLGVAGVGMILQEKSGNKNYGVLMAALGIGAQFGVLLPHGRAQESEADLIGINLMARAGFDPRESVTLWQNMDRESGGKQPPEFMSTHPSNSTRISALQSRMEQSLKVWDASQFREQAAQCRL